MDQTPLPVFTDWVLSGRDILLWVRADGIPSAFAVMRGWSWVGAGSALESTFGELVSWLWILAGPRGLWGQG